ncbi:MAG: hypothetical protein JST68_03700 [Bacteroidetes bacterium]|nr:hypothetical protein [Bacteroidota bacterium]
MKQLLFLAAGILLLSSCTTPTVIVKNKREATMPYTKILAIYLEEGCDFSLFDSTAYNICLRSCFSNAETYEARILVESRIRKHLETKGTEVLRSVDFFDAYNCDYAYFKRTVDSLKCDAVLIVGLRSHSHDEHERWVPDYVPPYKPGMTEGGPGGTKLIKYKTLNAFFLCDLLNPKSLYMPVWRAEIKERGKSYAAADGLNRNMTKKLAEALKAAHYIAH